MGEDTRPRGKRGATTAAVRRAAAKLEEEVAERTRLLAAKTAALEGANQELRNLTANLDQMVKQRTRALAESESELHRMNVQLDRLHRVKSEFIAIAAHELRTPMTSIVGYLELIVEKRLAELPFDLARPMRSLLRNAHRLRRLVEDLFDVSRLEAGRIALRRDACVLSEIVADVVAEATPLAEARRQRLSTRTEATSLLEGDRDRIHQIVANLVANSIKYTPEGGDIRVMLDVERRGVGPGWACIKVRDNGVGIPSGMLGRIFEPFGGIGGAEHHTSSGPDSAGLGLHIARGLAELHGGSIEVESEEGHFSEFTVRLPLSG